MVDILLATYNSEKYIREQIDSIIEQDYSEWNLIVRDDGSTDSTVNIINEYMEKYAGKIRLVCDDIVCKCAKKNFMELLKHARSEYVMFCDHDDVWLENKISKTLNKMKEIEEEQPEIPVLVYTNYLTVDHDLNVITDVNPRYLQTYTKTLSLNKLLVQNYVTGCTMMINKSLYSAIKPAPDEMLMHDGWLALYASCFGAIGHLDEATMKYRQHGNNYVGAVDVNSWQYIKSKLLDSEVKKNYSLLYAQAEAFRDQYELNMPQEKKEILNAFVSMKYKSKLYRIVTTIKYKFYKNTFIRILGQFVYM